jgi:hypothetical protein
MEQLFGPTLTNSAGRVIPTRWIGEQHVLEDLGRIPTAADWLRCIRAEPWMNRSRRLSRELEACTCDAGGSAGCPTHDPIPTGGAA